MPVGVVTLAERYGGRFVDHELFEAMVGDVLALLAPFEAEHRLRERMADKRAHLLGTSGTVTTVAGVHLGLPRYDRRQVDGCWLQVEHARAVTSRAARFDPRGARGTALHRQGPRRSGAGRLRHPGGAASHLAVRAPAGCRPRAARGYTCHLDGRGRRLSHGRPARPLETARMDKSMAIGNRGGGQGGRRQTKVRLQARQAALCIVPALARAPAQRSLRGSGRSAKAIARGRRSSWPRSTSQHRILKPGKRVVDLGAAPGGWSQVAADRVKSVEGRGQVVAIDLLDMEAIAGRRFPQAGLFGR